MPDRRLARLKAKFLRRSSLSPKPGNGVDPRGVHHPISSPCPPRLYDSASDKSPYSIVSRCSGNFDPADHDDAPSPLAQEGADTRSPQPPSTGSPPPGELQFSRNHRACTPPPTEPTRSSLHTPLTVDVPSPRDTPPLLTPQTSEDTPFQPVHCEVRTPTPVETPISPTTLHTVLETPVDDRRPSASWSLSDRRPSLAVRRQSLLPASHHHLINGLLGRDSISSQGGQSSRQAPSAPAEMVQRRVWVKRPGGSATLVPCLEDAVVDELRDQVIMKYSNSLGKSFDSPDIVIRIAPREGSNRQAHPERLLSPEESLATVLDTYYPGGQAIEEALVIDAPARRTPKPSPRHSIYHHHHSEPGEHGDYFPLMPVNANGQTPPAHPASSGGGPNAPSISILNTGVPPPLPSPGTRGSRHHRRPPLTRHTTNSPTLLEGAPVADIGVSPHSQPPSAPPAPTVPTPPAVPAEPSQLKTHTPPAPMVSPRLRKGKVSPSPATVFGGLIDGTVPPINVLIVEDNIINQRLLEAFMKRLSVRWKCAANGEEAVRKWRQGGFHLVLMDIQLPVMNGLDATKEIRRLERLNGIGVFSKTASGRSSASSTNAASPDEKRPGLQRSLSEDDMLPDLSQFRSPVIIVALTASSLQSDRHEALAAGCNDFLTKPVGFPWLRQKMTEWGCMQALIDFEGWRKWRGFVDSPVSSSPSADSAVSPMQTGDNKQISLDPRSPSALRTTTAANKTSKRPHGPRPSLPDAAEIMREDSWGSGSGDTDSPSSPNLTPADSIVPAPVDEPSPNGQ
ncbi:hypothetical protein N7474_001785 [Penicillium riverlandense]|uniref:uncharacterized protein n=1 Tax=Penicillium riverlandense TaxID=1903569 RepID=UPI0025468467|nr:uncharacterized protein N7474_001785 [Penicillium riverlandense]KAJ5833474.1 hypothetical protein N7474_001785 [Penicillium riverlandense]